jgi:diaminohydroxyphosphoribosylaminopyrimidine deaminase / 5-amino-6-(5-phosphoribosylamino)uracil reductase
MTAFSEADERWMRRALVLAARGLCTTDPNPRVGCVVVRDGQLVGEGWHERAGQGHAEVRALAVAGAAANGATAYVTLEPCAGTGRTPPCTEALRGARVARLVYAATDPDPIMRGGAGQLRAAGIDVAGGLLEAEARQLNVGFFRRLEHGLPWVRMKLAASLDGRTALANGASRWISGEAARADVQQYRARSSAVLTGIGTVLADDPALNVRVPGATRQPLRVLLDTNLRVPPGARLFSNAGRTLVMTAATDARRRAALERDGVQVEQLARAAGTGLELRAVLRRLAELQCNEVWVEAGATLSGALLSAHLVDELVLYLAPCLLGPDARPLAELPAISALTDRLTLTYSECVLLGDDLRITAQPRPAA